MPSSSTHHPATHLLAGAASGLLVCVALQPLDLLKTRLQQDGPDSRRPVVDRALWRSARSIVVEGGIRSLWRGTTPTIARVPGSALYFLSFEHIRQVMISTNLFSTSSSNLVSGAVARGLLGFLLMPVSVIKVRYECSYYHYTSMRQAASHIVAKEGIRGLYIGYGATALRDMPQAGLYVLFYEEFKLMARHITNYFHLQPPNVSLNLMSGAVAGLLATSVTQPLDLVRTRIQINPTQYTNTIQALVKIFKEEGIHGYFIGTTPRLIRKTLNSALTWTIYEEFVKLLKSN